MKLIDTMVIVGALKPDDGHHEKASAHLNRLAKVANINIPASTLIEFDLLMKARNYTDTERETTWLELSPKIPREKIISISPTALATSSQLQSQGMGYFDSLITALALERKASIVTNDKAIAVKVKTEW